MGSNMNEKPKNRVTISRGGETPARKVNAESGRVDRSFAQPNPSIKHEDPAPKAHASAEDAKKALSKNSKMGRDYDEQNESTGK